MPDYNYDSDAGLRNTVVIQLGDKFTMKKIYTCILGLFLSFSANQSMAAGTSGNSQDSCYQTCKNVVQATQGNMTILFYLAPIPFPPNPSVYYTEGSQGFFPSGYLVNNRYLMDSDTGMHCYSGCGSYGCAGQWYYNGGIFFCGNNWSLASNAPSGAPKN